MPSDADWTHLHGLNTNYFFLVTLLPSWTTRGGAFILSGSCQENEQPAYKYSSWQTSDNLLATKGASMGRPTSIAALIQEHLFSRGPSVRISIE